MERLEFWLTFISGEPVITSGFWSSNHSNVSGEHVTFDRLLPQMNALLLICFCFRWTRTYAASWTPATPVLCRWGDGRRTLMCQVAGGTAVVSVARVEMLVIAEFTEVFWKLLKYVLTALYHDLFHKKLKIPLRWTVCVNGTTSIRPQLQYLTSLYNSQFQYLHLYVAARYIF